MPSWSKINSHRTSRCGVVLLHERSLALITSSPGGGVTVTGARYKRMLDTFLIPELER